MSQKIIESVKRRVKGEARKVKQKVKAEINEQGQEVGDPQPLFIEVGQKPKETLDEKIRRVTLQVQADTVAKLQAQKMSDEEVEAILNEESDFSIPEDLENILTPYEVQGVVSELEEEGTITTETPSETVASESQETATTSSPAEQSVTDATETTSE